MTEMTFTQLNQKIQQHFAAEEYQAGLILATQSLPKFPKEFAFLNYYRICLAARLNAYEQASKILEDTLASGIWYAEPVLRQSPSLEPLQGLPEFERLVGISLQMQQADPAELLPMVVVRPDGACDPGQPGCPAVMVLHGNQDTAQHQLEAWSSLPGLGWLLAVPQSKHVLWAGAYAWTSHEDAADVRDHYEALTARYSINPDSVILGGFSMGAEVALAMALRGDIKAQGFILCGPGGPYLDNLDEWLPLLEASGKRKLRGYIIVGLADDTIPQDNIRKLVEMLNMHGHSTELKVFPGLEHEYPDDFEDTLAYALKYIMG